MLSFPSKAYLVSLVCTGLGTKESWRFDYRVCGRCWNESDIHQAWVGIIITLRDPRQPSKLISCLLRLDRFLFPLWVVNRAAGDGGSSLGGTRQRGPCPSRDQPEGRGLAFGGAARRRPTCRCAGRSAPRPLTALWSRAGLAWAAVSVLRADVTGLLGDALGSPPSTLPPKDTEAFCQV